MPPASTIRPDGATNAPMRGRYRLLRLLGRGGMASVHLAAIDGLAGFSRKLALKQLHPHLHDEPILVAQFVAEAKLMVRIDHPNVVEVLDVARDEHGVYLVMEHVAGASLAELVSAAQEAGSRLPLPVALRIVCDALAGLNAAHELRNADDELEGVVHRDFTPHNILIDRNGRAKLSDFGIAKVRAAERLTETGVVKGKLRFLSPEQVRDRPLDRRADLWAAGVMLWELASGERLWPQQDEAALLLAVATSKPRRLHDVAPDVPAACADVIHSALERSAERRIGSAIALRDAIEVAAAEHDGLASHEDVAQLIDRLAPKQDQALSADVEPPPSPATEATQVVTTISESGVATPAPSGWPRMLWLAAVAGVVGVIVAVALSASRGPVGAGAPDSASGPATSAATAAASEESLGPSSSGSATPTDASAMTSAKPAVASARLPAAIAPRPAPDMREPKPTALPAQGLPRGFPSSNPYE